MILFADDDETGRRVAVYNLRKAGHEVEEAADGAIAMQAFDPERHEVIVTDLKMPGVSGMELLRSVRQRAPQVPVVVITAFGSVDVAVDAMQAGAWDFVEKPFSRDRLRITVERALETARLRRDNLRLRTASGPDMIANSKEMLAVLALVDRIGPAGAPVLITGESGVGKELVARRVHAHSGRSGRFEALNCAAIPADLLEAELFGHAKGAFTGAQKAREGRFRRANHGTVFLDEVGELPLELQAKLLRVLQEGEVPVVGRDEPVSVDVRVVAATNRDPEQQVAEGHFREDLYYRLNVLRVAVPPLRDRRDDIVPLVQHFLDQSGRGLELPPAVAAELRARPWRGNVRELRNACERLAILAPHDVVRVEDLPSERIPTQPGGNWLDAIPPGLTLVDIEREVIAYALAQSRGNISEAARALGVPRHILSYRIDKHGLTRG